MYAETPELMPFNKVSTHTAVSHIYSSHQKVSKETFGDSCCSYFYRLDAVSDVKQLTRFTALSPGQPE